MNVVVESCEQIQVTLVQRRERLLGLRRHHAAAKNEKETGFVNV